MTWGIFKNETKFPMGLQALKHTSKYTSKKISDYNLQDHPKRKRRKKKPPNTNGKK